VNTPIQELLSIPRVLLTESIMLPPLELASSLEAPALSERLWPVDFDESGCIERDALSAVSVTPSFAWSRVDFWESGVTDSEILELTGKQLVCRRQSDDRDTDYPCGLSQSLSR